MILITPMLAASLPSLYDDEECSPVLTDWLDYDLWWFSALCVVFFANCALLFLMRATSGPGSTDCSWYDTTDTISTGSNACNLQWCNN
jgi:hypothetical protein